MIRLVKLSKLVITFAYTPVQSTWRTYSRKTG